MRKRLRSKRIVTALLWICAGVFLASILFSLANRRSNEIVREWERPASMGTPGSLLYYLSVVETDRDWRDFPFLDLVKRNHSIRVGSKYIPSRSGRDHWIKYSFHPGWDYCDLESFLDDAEVKWTDEGVELVLPSGHRLFIPRRMYAEGR